MVGVKVGEGCQVAEGVAVLGLGEGVAGLDIGVPVGEAGAVANAQAASSRHSTSAERAAFLRVKVGAWWCESGLPSRVPIIRIIACLANKPLKNSSLGNIISRSSPALKPHFSLRMGKK